MNVTWLIIGRIKTSHDSSSYQNSFSLQDGATEPGPAYVPYPPVASRI